MSTEADNAKLIQLTAETGMAGDVSLRIDRKPDFFSLLKMRGDTKVFIAEENDSIIGVICVSLLNVYVGGKIIPLRYIGDFKVAEQCRNKGIGLQLCNEIADYLVSQNADLVFLNVSKGNTKPFSFFKNRPNISDFDNIGIFKIFQVIGKRKAPKIQNHPIEESIITDEVLHFFNVHYRNYQLGTVLKKENFQSARIFIVRETGIIIAAICLVDTMPVKQNVITALSFKMKIALKLMKIYCGIAGLSKMPEINEPVKMLYIKYLAAGSTSKSVVKLLINHARSIAFEKSYSYVSIGLHEKDRFNDFLSGLPKLTFKSVGMLLSIKNNRDLIQLVKNGVPYEDYSLV